MLEAKSDLIIVDSSVWVEFFRSNIGQATQEIDYLLSLGCVAICEPIYCEILSGTSNVREFKKMAELLNALPMLSAPENIWEIITKERFELARKGIQAVIIDLWIALTALAYQVPLWTLDSDFQRIKKALPLELYK